MAGVVGAEVGLADGQGALDQGASGVLVALVVQDQRKVVQPDACDVMLGSIGELGKRQRPLEQLLCLPVLPSAMQIAGGTV